ncbi:MAG: STAS domain-containing protein [Bacteroidales bacterium]|nr:STAS domain-containing protein [Bacteroidales bacterium]
MFDVVRINNSSVVINVTRTNRLNFLNIEMLHLQVKKLMNSYCRSVLLNLENVSFIDSKAFEGLLRINEIALQNAVRFKCFNVSQELKELFELINNDNTIEIGDRSDIDINYFVEV